MKRSIIAVVLILVLGAVSSTGDEQAAPCIVMVEPGESIQAAIDAAPDGAVICLASGEWRENIEVRKSLTVRGQGPEGTTIRSSGEEDKPVVVVSAGLAEAAECRVVIEGMTVTGAAGPLGDGIYLESSAQASISDCRIAGNGGAGVLARDSAKAEVNSCAVEGNHGGVLAWVSAEVLVNDSTISGSFAAFGLGISSKGTLANSTVVGNVRGVVLSEESSATVSNTTISETKLQAILMTGASQAQVSSVTVAGNWYGNRPAIEFQEQAQASLVDCTIVGSSGDGICIRDTAQATITGCNVSENASVGIWIQDTAQAIITGCNFSENGSAGIDARDTSQSEIASCTLRGNWIGIGLSGSARATVRQNEIFGSTSVGIDVWDSRDSPFHGYVIGSRNLVHDNGSEMCCDLCCCSAAVCFLATEEGGELDRQTTP